MVAGRIDIGSRTISGGYEGSRSRGRVAVSIFVYLAVDASGFTRQRDLNGKSSRSTTPHIFSHHDTRNTLRDFFCDSGKMISRINTRVVEHSEYSVLNKALVIHIFLYRSSLFCLLGKKNIRLLR